MALLAAEQVKVNRQTGEVSLYGNRYWSEDCGRLHGQRVTVRFDPDDLMQAVHLYDQDGRFLTTAPLIENNGFDDVAGAKASAARLKRYRQSVRDGAEAEQLLAAEEVAAMTPGSPVRDVPQPSVIRQVRHHGNAAAARKIEPVEHTEHEQRESRVIDAIGRFRLVE